MSESEERPTLSSRAMETLKQALYRTRSDNPSEESFSRTVKPKLFGECPNTPLPLGREEALEQAERLRRPSNSSEESFSRTLSTGLYKYFPILSLEPTGSEEIERQIEDQRKQDNSSRLSQKSFSRTVSSISSIFSPFRSLEPIEEEEIEGQSGHQHVQNNPKGGSIFFDKISGSSKLTPFRPLERVEEEETESQIGHQKNSKEGSFFSGLISTLSKFSPFQPLEPTMEEDTQSNLNKDSFLNEFSTLSEKRFSDQPYHVCLPPVPQAEGRKIQSRQNSNESFSRTVKPGWSEQIFSDNSYRVCIPLVPLPERPSTQSSSRSSDASFSRTVKPVSPQQGLDKENIQVSVPYQRLLPPRFDGVAQSLPEYKIFRDILPDIRRILKKSRIIFQTDGIHLMQRYLAGEIKPVSGSMTIVVEAVWKPHIHKAWLNGGEELRTFLTEARLQNVFNIHLLYEQVGQLNVFWIKEGPHELEQAWPTLRTAFFGILCMYPELRNGWRKIDIMRHDPTGSEATSPITLLITVQPGLTPGNWDPTKEMLDRLLYGRGFPQAVAKFVVEEFRWPENESQ